MNYEQLEAEVWSRVEKQEAKFKAKYGKDRSSYSEDWTPLKAVRWFVSGELVQNIWEYTRKDLMGECFDGSWPTCTNRAEVEEWLEDEDQNGTEDSQIIEWLNEHFGC